MTLEVPVWVRDGGMLINREFLPAENPNSYYNYIKSLGHDPEDYGYFLHELTDEQKELLSSIPTQALYRELDLRERYSGF